MLWIQLLKDIGEGFLDRNNRSKEDNGTQAKGWRVLIISSVRLEHRLLGRCGKWDKERVAGAVS